MIIWENHANYRNYHPESSNPRSNFFLRQFPSFSFFSLFFFVSLWVPLFSLSSFPFFFAFFIFPILFYHFPIFPISFSIDFVRGPTRGVLNLTQNRPGLLLLSPSPYTLVDLLAYFTSPFIDLSCVHLSPGARNTLDDRPGSTILRTTPPPSPPPKKNLGYRHTQGPGHHRFGTHARER